MIPLTRKFYNSIVYHRKAINRSMPILTSDFNTISFIYHKASGVVESLSSTPLSLSADNQFLYEAVNLTEFTPETKELIRNYKHTFGKSQLIWDSEKKEFDVLTLNYNVRKYTRFIEEINLYDVDYDNEFIIDFSVTNLKGEEIDLSNFSEVSLKNMGDKDKKNDMSINNISGKETIQLPKENDQWFRVTINDFNEENVVRVKIKHIEHQTLWLTAFIALRANK